MSTTTLNGVALSVTSFILMVATFILVLIPFPYWARSGEYGGIYYLGYASYHMELGPGYQYYTQDFTCGGYMSYGSPCSNDPNSPECLSCGKAEHLIGAVTVSVVAFSVSIASHLGTFVLYIIYDTCARQCVGAMRKGVFVVSVIGILIQLIGILSSFAFAGNGYDEVAPAGGFVFALVLFILSIAQAVYAYFKYSGGNFKTPPPTSTTVVVLPGGSFSGGNIPMGTPLGNPNEIPIGTPIGSADDIPMGIPLPSTGPKSYTLLIHGIGQYPQKITVKAANWGDFLAEVGEKLGLTQSFLLLLHDTEFNTVAQLRDLESLPQKAALTVKFTPSNVL